MERTLDTLSKSLVGVHSGNVTPGVIDTVKVLVYNNLSPIKHIATTGRSGNIVFVDPYDSSHVPSINKALQQAGFSAYVFSKTRVAIAIPEPNKEQKLKIEAHLKKLGEEAKIAIRNIRKNFRQSLSKEEMKDLDSEIQKNTDECIREIDDIIRKKVLQL